MYRLLLLLYPKQFRQEYGAEMARLFRERCRAEGRLRVWFEVLPDLVITAWREHMDTLRQDLFYTVRGLARSPGFAAVVFFTLALGIGANTAIFSVVKGVLLDPLPYRDPERLVQLYEKRPRQGRVRNVVSAPDFIDWKKQNTVFDEMSAVTGAAFTLPAQDGAQLIYGLRVTKEFFSVFGIQPVMGRNFLPEEESPGKDRVVLLAQGLWQRQFGADPSIVGRKITLNGEPFLVIGVLPQMPDMFAGKTEIWQPLVLNPQAGRGQHFLNVYARMKPGVSLARTRADMDVVAGRLESQFPDANTGHGVNVFSLEEELTGSVRPALLMLMGAVGLVLLVACANVANLYMARTVQRRREISIRTALGAGSGRLMRQLLTESLLVSLVGAATGIALAFWGVQLLVAANPGNLPRLHNIRIDGTVLLFTVGIAMLTALLFGLAPALQAAKTEIGERTQGEQSRIDGRAGAEHNATPPGDDRSCDGAGLGNRFGADDTKLRKTDSGPSGF